MTQTRTEETQSNAREVDEGYRELIENRSVMTRDESRDEDVTIIREIFDTDKPADPATGTPPLKERVTESRQSTAGSKTTLESVTTVDFEAVVNTVEAVETHTRTDVDEQVRTSEKTGTNGITVILAVLSVVALSLALYKLGTVIYRRIKLL